jgi:NAD(P)-dependent dehydrogenase (short-subunit alcohol dehydrogenase family)
MSGAQSSTSISPTRLTRAVVPLMKGRAWGRIINFGSGSIFEGVVGQAYYVAAKAGIVGLSRCIARAEVPEDLVGTAFFLASSDADFISGQIIN